MSAQLPEPIEDVAEFLVHALELENESAERYRQLAAAMRVHHNLDVASLFRQLADMSDAHAAEVTARAEGMILPALAPWDFKWTCPGSPEQDCLDEGVSYLMGRLEVLRLALHNETRGRDFYAQVAASTSHPRVRALAAEMAEEESEHVVLIEGWIRQVGQPAQRPLSDLDPPNMPE